MPGWSAAARCLGVFAAATLIAQAASAADTTLEISRTEAGMTITWTDPAFMLESATDLAGPWTPLLSGVSSPYLVPDGEVARKYYRLRQVTSVTVGVFEQLEEGGEITPTGLALNYLVGVDCQTWSRTAKAHGSFETSHLHYNAAAGVSYAFGSFTWTEYGPAHSQTEIDGICAAGTGGFTKTVNTVDYEPDKDVFLKITNVE